VTSQCPVFMWNKTTWLTNEGRDPYSSCFAVTSQKDFVFYSIGTPVSYEYKRSTLHAPASKRSACGCTRTNTSVNKHFCFTLESLVLFGWSCAAFSKRFSVYYGTCLCGGTSVFVYLPLIIHLVARLAPGMQDLAQYLANCSMARVH
jgi:hypothetical protein